MSDHLTEELAALRSPAPPTLLPEVLARTGLADRYVETAGPLGTVYVAFNEHGISAVDVAADAPGFEEAFAARFGRAAVRADALPPHLPLDRAIAEGRPGSLPIDLRTVTEFQARVLRKAAEIPRGEVRPYSWVAGEIGKPGATRAVGTALARNPVPLVIPCHRVVRSDGTLGDYSLGEAANKGRLLREEGVDLERLRGLAARGVRWIGSDTTRIFCHPTCRDARRITDAHRVEFRNSNDAERAGYRPCKRCRPAAAA
jgi:O-6-methylguanine DNA methyltransferase